jgi:hypothetical protein
VHAASKKGKKSQKQGKIPSSAYSGTCVIWVKGQHMTNTKPAYWIPCLGAALIWNDPECSLNAREERVLLFYHTGMILMSVVGAGLLIGQGAG